MRRNDDRCPECGRKRKKNKRAAPVQRISTFAILCVFGGCCFLGLLAVYFINVVG